MRRIYWDTMIFAYFLEGNAVLGPQAKHAYASMLKRGDKLCTSVFTLGELLVLPRRKNDTAAVGALNQFFRSGEVEVFSFNFDTAGQYGRIRAETRLKPADAIHLASAITNGVHAFVTNDQDVLRTHIDGIPFVVGLDGKIF